MAYVSVGEKHLSHQAVLFMMTYYAKLCRLQPLQYDFSVGLRDESTDMYNNYSDLHDLLYMYISQCINYVTNNTEINTGTVVQIWIWFAKKLIIVQWDT